jgi:hypothetical protein
VGVRVVVVTGATTGAGIGGGVVGGLLTRAGTVVAERRAVLGTLVGAVVDDGAATVVRGAAGVGVVTTACGRGTELLHPASSASAAPAARAIRRTTGSLRTMHRARAATAHLALLIGIGALAGCASAPKSVPASAPDATTVALPVTPTTRPAVTTTEPVTTVAPPRTTTTVPAFRSAITAIAATELPFTYRAGCPVEPSALRLVHLSYWGFDDQPHAGTMVVAATVATQVVTVFRSLYAARFPIREMQPEDAFGGHDPASMDADNTSGFNCRDAVAPGPPQWSAHAFGTAIDVNPVENPYLEGGAVQPSRGSAYLDRADMRPGMSGPGTALNEAFAAVGWQWGGRWTSSPDYQHFSANGG